VLALHNLKISTDLLVSATSSNDCDGDSTVLTALSASPQAYVVKQIRKSISGNMKYNGIIDLAKEARFLSKLSHPNIIQIVSTGGTQGDVNFYLILERMDKSLGLQILDWQADSIKIRFPTKKSKEAWRIRRLKRVEVARQVSSAMAFLHERNIMFRDLKPNNVGVDTGRSVVKIFDFGLAKELKPSFHIEGSVYKNTKNAGTRRYMAPEVYLSGKYGLSGDVFSFAILLWELMTLKSAFSYFSKEEHATFVYQLNCRPKISFGWPSLLKAIVRCCWSEDHTDRLTFQQIESALASYIESKKSILSS
jgi:serine/threonine protein kinase